MFRALSTAGDRRLIDLSIRRPAAPAGIDMTNYRIPPPASESPTVLPTLFTRGPLTGLLAALSLLVASALVPAVAQEPAPEPVVTEPAVVPEPVVEDALPEVEPESDFEPGVEPVVEAEAPASESSSPAAPVVDPPSRVARLGHVEGEVTVAPAGTDEWAEAVLNRPLTSGDRLWVEDGGRAELQIGSAAVYLDGDTGFGFLELDDGVLQATLTEGEATVRIRRLVEGEIVRVETPHSTVYLNRVGEYHVEVDKAGDRTIVKTRHGEAEVKGGGDQRFVVRDNERGVFAGLQNLSGHIEPLGPRTAFESWANDRDARSERSESAKYVSRDVIGYEDLDDNGDWVSEPEYGYVWRPRHVVSGWAPYRYGRWVYVSPWGWSWVDNARWGFAPFHYGRWAYVRHRWCWVPGPRHLRPVYAPALVGWVGGPSVSVSLSFGNVGWYPLGPHDFYYPGYRHTPRYGRYVNVSNTIIVNNNYFYGGRRIPHPRFDHRRHGYGVTAVSREHFVGGRPISNHLVRIGDSEVRRWRGVREPPAIAPYRESILAGQARRPPPDVDRFRGFRRGGDSFAGRVPFHTERRAIEANGGRPIGRSELRSNRNPKDRGDFFAVRPGTSRSDIKRAERAVAGSALSGSNRNLRTRELNNDSVREWQNRIDRDRPRERSDSASSPPRYTRWGAGSNTRSGSSSNSRSGENSRERVEIIRPDESRDRLRRDHMQRPPANALQQRDNSYYRPRTATGEPSRSYNRVESRPPSQPRSEPRRWSQPRSQPRSEPRREFSAPRSQPQPRAQPRSQPQPRASSHRSESRSSSQPRSSSRSGGDRSRPSGSRPSQPR